MADKRYVREIALEHAGIKVYHAYKEESEVDGLVGRKLYYHFSWHPELAAEPFDVRDIPVPSGTPSNWMEETLDVERVLREAIENGLNPPIDPAPGANGLGR